MIARTWHGRAARASADAYCRHFAESVMPHLAGIPGHRGACLLRRDGDGGSVEFLAVTLWESMETIKAFAGPDPEVAVVEPAARAVLTDFDGFARHYEVVCRMGPVGEEAAP